MFLTIRYNICWQFWKDILYLVTGLDIRFELIETSYQEYVLKLTIFCFLTRLCGFCFFQLEKIILMDILMFDHLWVPGIKPICCKYIIFVYFISEWEKVFLSLQLANLTVLLCRRQQSSWFHFLRLNIHLAYAAKCKEILRELDSCPLCETVNKSLNFLELDNIF